MSDAPASGAPPRLALPPVERRVLAVLVEKSLATPDYYPMTLKATVAACNQRNNRDPIMDLDEEAVEAAIGALMRQGFVLAIKADTGWARRFRHELDKRLHLQVREQAVLAELLLRGSQSEGELRSRVARMRPIEDLEELHESLARLEAADPPLARRLTPDGVVRGVRHAHLLYPDDEWRGLLAAEGVHAERPPVRASGPDPVTPRDPGAQEPAAAAGPRDEDAVAALEDRVARLEERLTRLERQLGA